MSPGNLTICEGYVFEMRKVRKIRILTVMHVRLEINDNGVFKFDSEVMLLGTRCRRTIKINTALGKKLTTG